MKFRHLNHEKLIILAVRVGLIGGLSTLGWEVPVTSVIDPTIPECDKATHWDDLDDSCKIKILEENTVGSDAESISDLIVSVLRGSSYSEGRTPESGGHPGIDIVSVAGTPIYAIYDGIVQFAGEKGTYGNVVTIKHTLPDNTVVYSNYSHLEKFFVQVGEEITSGKQLGTMGKTGFTMGKYGNHLDFQITTADSPSHPYGYSDCAFGYMNAVEEGSCKEQLEQYTIDPIVFFKEYADIDLSPFAPEHEVEHGVAESFEEIDTNGIDIEIHESIEKDESTDDIDEGTNQYTVVPDNRISTLLELLRKDRANQSNSIFSGLQTQYSTLQTPGEKENSMAGTVQIDDTPTVQKDDTIPYSIDWNVGSTVLEQGKLNKITFTIKDLFGVNYSGSMDEKIVLEYDKSIISIAPSRFGRIVEGTKTVFITPKEEGNTVITIKYGEKVLGTETITVLSQ